MSNKPIYSKFEIWSMISDTCLLNFVIRSLKNSEAGSPGSTCDMRRM